MAKDRPPSFSMYPAPWFQDTRLMTRDQRCRYFEALLHSWSEECYGVAPEDQWRRWLGYTEKQWPKVREVYAIRFRIDGMMWTQKKLLEVRAEQLVNRDKAARGGISRASALTEVEKSLSAQLAAKSRWDACLMRTPASASAFRTTDP